MATNRVSAQLSDKDRDEILAALATIKEKLPFLIGLSAEERKSLPRLGDKSQAFVKKALELARQHPGFLPRDFDVDEMANDFTLFESLAGVLTAMRKLTEEVEDTYTAAGSEAYVAALLVYNYAKASGVVMTGLDSAVDDLGKRFARKAKTLASPAPADSK
jgi:hypothetical protein